MNIINLEGGSAEPHSFAKPMLEKGGGGGFLQCLLCDMRLRGVNSLLCRQRWTYLLLRDAPIFTYNAILKFPLALSIMLLSFTYNAFEFYL